MTLSDSYKKKSVYPFWATCGTKTMWHGNEENVEKVEMPVTKVWVFEKQRFMLKED